MKKLFALALSVCMILGMSVAVSAAAGINTERNHHRGAHINVAEAGMVLGESYTIEIDVRSFGAHGIRVRWASGGVTEDGANNDTTNNAHSSATAASVERVATQVPADFRNYMQYGDRMTFTINFTYGAPVADLDPQTMDFIVVYGHGGSNEFTVDAVRVTHVPAATVVTPPTPPSPPVTLTSDSTTITFGIFAGMLILATTALIIKKRQLN